MSMRGREGFGNGGEMVMNIEGFIGEWMSGKRRK